MKEGFGHSLDLLVVMMIDLSAMVKHIADVGNGEAKAVNSLSSLLIRTVPEAAHSVFKVLSNGVSI